MWHLWLLHYTVTQTHINMWPPPLQHTLKGTFVDRRRHWEQLLCAVFPFDGTSRLINDAQTENLLLLPTAVEQL